MHKSYLERRKKSKNYTSYRLHKRIGAIRDILERNQIKNADSILDVGTFDAAVLREITQTLRPRLAVGIDNDLKGQVSPEGCKEKNIKFALGDASSIPFRDSSFDFLLATAVIEHIKDTGAVIRELHRVLKKEGLICITLPNPFFDRINTFFNDTGHVRRFGLKKISAVLENNGFKVVQGRHFMFCPFFKFPFEERVENLARSFKLDFILFNHIILARKIK